jgi:hypothetical protein
MTTSAQSRVTELSANSSTNDDAIKENFALEEPWIPARIANQTESEATLTSSAYAGMFLMTPSHP